MPCSLQYRLILAICLWLGLILLRFPSGKGCVHNWTHPFTSVCKVGGSMQTIECPYCGQAPFVETRVHRDGVLIGAVRYCTVCCAYAIRVVPVVEETSNGSQQKLSQVGKRN